jgi:predicted RNA-binding Zn-ribbon protein involved in translation (DUF1610 family)
MSKTTSLICENCGKNTLHTKSSVNHILHLLLSIVTGGIWLIVWAILVLIPGSPWKCSVCGKIAVYGFAGDIYRSYKQKELAQQIKNYEKKCPYCAETIKAEAVVCRYCGKELHTNKSEIKCPNCGAVHSGQRAGSLCKCGKKLI